MLTKDYIIGYRDALNNLLYVYRSELVQLRKTFYGIYVEDKLLRVDYKDGRKQILKNIKLIRNTKNTYKQFINKINKLSKS